MPEEQKAPETPNPVPEGEPAAQAPDNSSPQKPKNAKRRRIDFDWKSQYGSAEGYSVSKRVILGPAAETAPTSAQPKPSLDVTKISPPLPPVVLPPEQPIPQLEQPEPEIPAPNGQEGLAAGTLEMPVGEGLTPAASGVTVEEEPLPASAEELPKEVSTPTEAGEAPEELAPTPITASEQEPQPESLESQEPPPVITAVGQAWPEYPSLEDQGAPAEATIEPSIPVVESGLEESAPEATTEASTLALPTRQPSVVRVCPYLGLSSDRSTHFIEPSDAQVCYSPVAPGAIDVDYQRRFCFSDFGACKRFPKDEQDKPAALPLPAMAAPVLATAAGPSLAPMPEPRRRSRVFDFVLWGVAIVLAIVAILAALPILFGNSGAPASAPVAINSTSTATVTPTEAPTEVAASTEVPTLAPLIIPTPAENQVVLDILPDPSLTGWVVDNESEPHWGDAAINAGKLKGQVYTGIVHFYLKNLPPGSKVTFAALELTGTDASHLGKNGEWQIALLQPRTNREWLQASSSDIASAPADTTFAQTLPFSQLAAGNLNRITFDDSQRQLIANEFVAGSLTFRLSGPSSESDNLFGWDAGIKSSLNAPVLHLVVEPGPYAVVTNTSTPSNVITAAAYAFQQTAQATRVGTPTPFPPGVATATPGGETIFVPADTAVPGNIGTAIARIELATAVAMTTGTYTPTPVGLIVVYPTATPFLISPNQLSTATPPGSVDLGAIRSTGQYHALVGSIVVLSNYYAGTNGSCDKGCPIVLNSGGGVLGQLSSSLYYSAALDRDQYSPDFSKKVAYINDSQGIQQIGYVDLSSKTNTILTNFRKGISFDAAWSPDGSAIAFIHSESPTLGEDVYFYDFGTQKETRVTNMGSAGQGFPNNQHPSWSPDSQNIVFWSSRGGGPQIWIVGRNGQNLIDLSSTRGGYTETDPVWVK